MSSEALRDKYDQLYEIIKRLRSGEGCPWDRKQTPGSIKKYLLEETEELAEAIDKGDKQHILEEIGDLYFILILLTIMHEEQGKFNGCDVLDTITAKMIRRHPHVFAGLPTGSESELRRQWEEIKAAEKNKIEPRSE